MADRPNATDLAFSLSLEPARAVEHLQAKGLQVSGAWRTVNEAAHARAFTVANVTQLDVLKDIQDELVRAQKDGLTLQQFRDRLVPTLTQKGWFSKPAEPVTVPDGSPPDPATGELPTRKRLTARRLQTIFQTNMQSSMMAARYRELMGNVDRRPWFQYVAVLDGRTRPAHRAMNGRVFRYDDPGWRVWWPPCGWNCRCRVRARSSGDLADAGLTPQSSEGQLRDSTVPLPDGTTSTVTRYTPKDGGPPFTPDPGFNGNPAMVQAADRLAVVRAPQVLPAAQADQALRRLFTAPQRQAQLQAFVQTTREARQPMGITAGLAALDEAAVLKLADEGVSFDQAAPVTLEDRLITAADKGDALALEDWASLPRVVAFGELLWDARGGALVYARQALKPAGARNWVQVVVKPDAKTNDVRQAVLVTRADLRRYTQVRGALKED